MFGAIRQSHELQQLFGPMTRLFGIDAGNVGRNHDVLNSREFGQQLMELEHEADMAVAEVAQLLLGELGHIDGIDVHCTAVGTVESSDNLE